MILLYCDETSLEPNQGAFFIFGGLSVPSENAVALSHKFSELLRKHGYDPIKSPAHPQPLKFSVKKLPEGVTPETVKSLKREVPALAAASGCHLHVTAILHDVALKKQKRHWQLNLLLRCFEAVLEREKKYALVVIDHYEDNEVQTLRSLMQERFLLGLRYPGGEFPLTNVVGFAEGCIGSSHFASILDVALGCVRYGVNKRENDKERQTGRILLEQVSPLFPREKEGKVSGLHFSFAPESVYPPMRRKYRELADYLAECGLCRHRPPRVPFPPVSPGTRVP